MNLSITDKEMINKLSTKRLKEGCTPNEQLVCLRKINAITEKYREGKVFGTDPAHYTCENFMDEFPGVFYEGVILEWKYNESENLMEAMELSDKGMRTIIFDMNGNIVDAMDFEPEDPINVCCPICGSKEVRFVGMNQIHCYHCNEDHEYTNVFIMVNDEPCIVSKTGGFCFGKTSGSEYKIESKEPIDRRLSWLNFEKEYGLSPRDLYFESYGYYLKRRLLSSWFEKLFVCPKEFLTREANI